MPKPSTPAIWASDKTLAFKFQPSAAQQAQGFDYIAVVRPSTGAPITDDHDWPLNQITTALKWLMDQVPSDGLKSAAFRSVGNGTNQIPDMSSFGSGSGWMSFPDGRIWQWGIIPDGAGDITTNFPIPFPNKCHRVFPALSYTAGSGSIGYIAGVAIDRSRMVSRSSSSSLGGSYLAIGE